jgi:molybdenum cofactor biosynthesis enzyme MoaA
VSDLAPTAEDLRQAPERPNPAYGTPAFAITKHSRDQLSKRLRLSLVGRCNLACFFCHNEGQGDVRSASSSTLTIDELVALVRSALDAGIREIKLTGGEPLIYRDGRKNIVDLVAALNDLRAHDAFGLSITTNGLLLPQFAGGLASAGLDRCTVSLHTLSNDTFHELIARPGTPLGAGAVVDGIHAAVANRLEPVKVNTVVYGSSQSNVDELRDIINLVREAGVSELRLYTLLDHPGFSTHKQWYRYWDDDLLEAVGAAAYTDGASRASFVRESKAFVRNWSRRLYPKATFIAGLDDTFELAIEAMQAHRFSQMGITDEGPYALRVSHTGRLRGLLTGDHNEIDLSLYLKQSRSHDALAAQFRNARRSLLPMQP